MDLDNRLTGHTFAPAHGYFVSSGISDRCRKKSTKVIFLSFTDVRACVWNVLTRKPRVNWQIFLASLKVRICFRKDSHKALWPHYLSKISRKCPRDWQLATGASKKRLDDDSTACRACCAVQLTSIIYFLNSKNSNIANSCMLDKF
jgi:hypothetical protein